MKHTASLLLLLSLLAMVMWPSAAQEGLSIPAPAIDLPASMATSDTAVFAAGCFWGVQGVYQHTKGVTNAVSGYAGGAANTAN